MSKFSVLPLRDRRVISDLTMLFRIMKGLAFAPELYSNIEFHNNRRTLRFNELFSVPFRSTNHGQNSPLGRMVRSFNDHCNDAAYFGLSVCSFKHRIKSQFLHSLYP